MEGRSPNGPSSSRDQLIALSLLALAALMLTLTAMLVAVDRLLPS
jgi:hypothetical protein